MNEHVIRWIQRSGPAEAVPCASGSPARPAELDPGRDILAVEPGTYDLHGANGDRVMPSRRRGGAS